MKFIHGGHFEFQWNLKKITCTSPYREKCDSKIWIISFFKFCSFCAHKKIWGWPLAAILKFCSIFKKSLAYPHVARNVMLKFNYIPKKLKLICGGHFEFQYNFEKVTCTSSQADMWNIANNCGFIHRSMKFGTCLDIGPGKLFSYGATRSKTCVKFGSHFGVQYALLTWETSTTKAMQGSYLPCLALLSNLKLPQHVTNSICGCLCSCRHSKLCWLSKIAPQKVTNYVIIITDFALMFSKALLYWNYIVGDKKAHSAILYYDVAKYRLFLIKNVWI